MSSIGYVAMAVADLAVLLAGFFVVSLRSPEYRDWDFRARLFPMSIRFKVAHNGYGRARP